MASWHHPLPGDQAEKGRLSIVRCFVHIFCRPTSGIFHTKMWKWKYAALASTAEDATPAREGGRAPRQTQNTLISGFISRC